MKYRRIYQTLEQYGAKIAYDGSGWRYAERFQTYIQRTRPLWIVAEAPARGRRIWISHESGRFFVTTADMTIPSNSREYHKSQLRRMACSQGDVADYLKSLLAGPPSTAV